MERIIELIIDEENEFSGIEAISVVENPAIEEDFIALKKQPIRPMDCPNATYGAIRSATNNALRLFFFIKIRPVKSPPTKPPCQDNPPL